MGQTRSCAKPGGEVCQRLRAAAARTHTDKFAREGAMGSVAVHVID